MIEILSPLAPPVEIADWHNNVLNLLQTAKSAADEQPEDNLIGLDFLAIAMGLEEMEEEITEIENETPVKIRQRMVEAGCFSSDTDPAPGPETVEDDHANDFQNATAITVGEAVDANLDYRDDTDLFHFIAQAGQLYQIDVALGTLDDSYAELQDADGWGVADNDDYGDSRASRIVWAAPRTGDYYVSVGSAWGAETGTGTYTLTVSLSDIDDDHANDFQNATAITVGEAVDANLDYRDDTDLFHFTAQAGQLYQIDVALGTLDDSYAELQDADGWGVVDNDDYGDSRASRIVWAAPRTGDYYVSVGSAWGAETGTGTYTLTVALSDIDDDHANDFQNATAITVGEAVDANLDYRDDTDLFHFTAQAGQLYQIDVALGTLDDSYAELQDADGWGVVDNDDYGDSRASRIVWAAPRTGDYYVSVGSAWGAETGTGTYTLTVALSDIDDDHANRVEDATSIAVGEVTQGTLDYPGDEDFFHFIARAGQLYRIDVALGTLEDSVVLLLNSFGWDMEYNEDYGDTPASRIDWEAPDSGDYYIVVLSQWGSETSTGTYILTVDIP